MDEFSDTQNIPCGNDMTIIADSLCIPAKTEAILWDMDGVLLDTLGFDYEICNQLLNQHFGSQVNVKRDFIRSIFAYDPVEFWRLILECVRDEHGIPRTESYLDQILESYNSARNASNFRVNPGIVEILDAAVKISLKMAVVSNNPLEDLKKILSQAGIIDYFSHIVGNDHETLNKKPAPDTYLLGAKILGVKSERCVVVEDSLLGAESGSRAKCFTIGVATGSADFESLSQSPWTDQNYISFQANRLWMGFGNVSDKQITTPNEFISHMVEHIAWRLGISIDLYWNNDDWGHLGRTIGLEIGKFQHQRESGVAMGMIDDGSAEVLLELSDEHFVQMESIRNVDLDWFLGLRCEQLHSGRPLVELIGGLAEGLAAKMKIRVCGLEDPHHSWEGVFRSLGIALSHIFLPEALGYESGSSLSEKDVCEGDADTNSRSFNFAKAERKTAESEVSVSVDFSKKMASKFHFNVSSNVDVSGFRDILRIFSEQAGFNTVVEFDAKVLSSSHVVLEDTGLVLGRALREVFLFRMLNCGINGAGSSVHTKGDLETQPVRVGASVEGRKFWKILPFEDTYDDVRTRFIIGHNVCDGLFSEDLDDFIDGLSGGLGCSIIIHMKELMDPDEGWQMVFENLGKAMKEVFALNPYRRGVPPGVKGTLS
jgi:HAD superfamily hydrolase (TIGR01509 family)